MRGARRGRLLGPGRAGGAGGGRSGNPKGGFGAEPATGDCSDLDELEALAAAALAARGGDAAGTESAAGDWTDLELDAMALSALGLDTEAPEDGARTPVETALWEDAGALNLSLAAGRRQHGWCRVAARMVCILLWR